MIDRSEQIVEDIKWTMFGMEENFKHSLRFAYWCGDGHSFVVKDVSGNEYRVCVTKEGV